VLCQAVCLLASRQRALLACAEAQLEKAAEASAVRSQVPLCNRVSAALTRVRQAKTDPAVLSGLAATPGIAVEMVPSEDAVLFPGALEDLSSRKPSSWDLPSTAVTLHRQIPAPSATDKSHAPVPPAQDCGSELFPRATGQVDGLVVSAASDPWHVVMTHVADAYTKQIALVVTIFNRTPMSFPQLRLRLALGPTLRLVDSESNATFVLNRLEPNKCVEWRCLVSPIRVHRSRVTLHVSFPKGGDGQTSRTSGHVGPHTWVQCQPYEIPLNHLLVPANIGADDALRQWNRSQPASVRLDVSSPVVGGGPAGVLASLAKTPFARVSSQGSASASTPVFHMLCCAFTWFDEWLCFALSGSLAPDRTHWTCTLEVRCSGDRLALSMTEPARTKAWLSDTFGASLVLMHSATAPNRMFAKVRPATHGCPNVAQALATPPPSAVISRWAAIQAGRAAQSAPLPSAAVSAISFENTFPAAPPSATDPDPFNPFGGSPVSKSESVKDSPTPSYSYAGGDMALAAAADAFGLGVQSFSAPDTDAPSSFGVFGTPPKAVTPPKGSGGFGFGDDDSNNDTGFGGASSSGFGDSSGFGGDAFGDAETKAASGFGGAESTSTGFGAFGDSGGDKDKGGSGFGSSGFGESAGGAGKFGFGASDGFGSTSDGFGASFADQSTGDLGFGDSDNKEAADSGFGDGGFGGSDSFGFGGGKAEASKPQEAGTSGFDDGFGSSPFGGDSAEAKPEEKDVWGF